MNHLAHLRLAPADPLLRLGNLCGDFVQGIDLATLPEPLRLGVAQHRAVDRFTDAHPIFRRSRERLPPALRRYGGVLIDVFYDHFLARGWDRFGDGRPLRAFADEVYADLDTHRAILPPRLQHVAPFMQREDWLVAYADLDGIATALTNMSRRLRRSNPLAEGAAALRTHYETLASDFAAFFGSAGTTLSG